MAPVSFQSETKMIFFTNTELFTTRTSTEETTQEVTSTSEITTAVFTTELITTTELKTTTEKTTEALIPIMESKKDIMLLAMAGTILLAIAIMIPVFVCRRKPKKRENLELFESLAASSSTTVFDKDQ